MKFQKGQSGNPGGRPKALVDLKALARTHTREAIDTLVQIMSGPKIAPAARVQAASALLDRGYGKPTQHVAGEDDGPIVLQIVRYANTDSAE